MISYSSLIQVFKKKKFICYVDRIFNYICYLHASQSASLCGRGLGTKCKWQTWHWNLNSRDVEKALGTVNHEKTQLAEKFKAAESVRQSAEAGLKIAEAQAKD